MLVLVPPHHANDCPVLLADVHASPPYSAKARHTLQWLRRPTICRAGLLAWRGAWDCFGRRNRKPQINNGTETIGSCTATEVDAFRIDSGKHMDVFLLRVNQTHAAYTSMNSFGMLSQFAFRNTRYQLEIHALLMFGRAGGALRGSRRRPTRPRGTCRKLICIGRYISVCTIG